jgi:hypothetical protein
LWGLGVGVKAEGSRVMAAAAVVVAQGSPTLGRDKAVVAACRQAPRGAGQAGAAIPIFSQPLGLACGTQPAAGSTPKTYPLLFSQHAACAPPTPQDYCERKGHM